MKSVIKRLICFAASALMLAAFACTQTPSVEATETPAPSPTAAATPEPTLVPTPAVEEDNIPIETPVPTETPTPEPTPTPTPEPTPVYITIGAVGDIMMPSMVVADAKTKETGEYDFTTLFAPFADLFGSVDLMCGNLETPIAGKKAGYSGKKDAQTGLISFNAPDSVLDALKGYGVDVLTTANNHCMDKGADGLYRTIEQLRGAGFIQTGTYLNAADRQDNPCVVDVNGVRIGIVASTRLLNHAYKNIDRDAEHTIVGYLTDKEKLSDAVLQDIERVKQAGAEFIIMFAHWDYETDAPTAAVTKSLAKQLFEAGVDCIVGSHPHRIKGAEFMTVNRADGPYTGLVLYSLGNFTANQEFSLMVGLYVQLTLEKDYLTNRVTLYDAAVLPSYVLRRNVKDAKRFTVVPAYSDPNRIEGLVEPLTDTEIKTIAKARSFAMTRLGTVKGLHLLDE